MEQVYQLTNCVAGGARVSFSLLLLRTGINNLTTCQATFNLSKSAFWTDDRDPTCCRNTVLESD